MRFSLVPVLEIGSSPRGRGTRDPQVAILHAPRFIPARAGNTRPRSSPAGRRSVHPRAGGEHVTWSRRCSRDSGSSPRGRGTRPARRAGPGALRFIPARAGNTPAWGRSSPSPTVHPRAGGEHMCRAANMLPKDGSSPRGRGTLGPRERPGPRLRFIPARAGNTRASSTTAWTPSVHPRAGGEHLEIGDHLSRYAGSSPRGRGTPPRRHDVADDPHDPVRFIPARAGNTRTRFLEQA